MKTNKIKLNSLKRYTSLSQREEGGSLTLRNFTTRAETQHHAPPPKKTQPHELEDDWPHSPPITTLGLAEIGTSRSTLLSFFISFYKINILCI